MLWTLFLDHWGSENALRELKNATSYSIDATFDWHSGHSWFIEDRVSKVMDFAVSDIIFHFLGSILCLIFKLSYLSLKQLYLIDILLFFSSPFFLLSTSISQQSIEFMQRIIKLLLHSSLSKDLILLLFLGNNIIILLFLGHFTILSIYIVVSLFILW